MTWHVMVPLWGETKSGSLFQYSAEVQRATAYLLHGTHGKESTVSESLSPSAVF